MLIAFVDLTFICLLQYIKLAFAVLVLTLILTDFNGKSGTMVSANPRPGHSQLEYYKREQKNRDTQGRRIDEAPWAQGYRYNHANPVIPSSISITIIVATIINMVYA